MSGHSHNLHGARRAMMSCSSRCSRGEGRKIHPLRIYSGCYARLLGFSLIILLVSLTDLPCVAAQDSPSDSSTTAPTVTTVTGSSSNATREVRVHSVSQEQEILLTGVTASSADQLATPASQQIFISFMINLTEQFYPKYASQEDLMLVTTEVSNVGLDSFTSSSQGAADPEGTLFYTIAFSSPTNSTVTVKDYLSIHQLVLGEPDNVLALDQMLSSIQVGSVQVDGLGEITLLNQGAESNTNLTALDPKRFFAWERFVLVFLLDGLVDRGIMNSTVRNNFKYYMENTTEWFVPGGFITQKELEQVNTTSLVTRSTSDQEITEKVQDAIDRLESTSANVYMRSAFIYGDSGRNLQYDDEGNTTFFYIYHMNYSSPTVNVSEFPRIYKNNINQPNIIANLTAELRYWLDIPPENTLITVGIWPLAGGDPREIFEDFNLTTYAPVSSSNFLLPNENDTMAPSPSPSFLVNSTSFQSFSLQFTVSGTNYTPGVDFVDDTTFSDIMTSLTPEFAPPEDDLSKISAYCLRINPSWQETTSTPLALLPTTSPSSLSSTTEDGTQNISKRNLSFLRQPRLGENRDLQDAQLIDPLLSNITSTILWTYQYDMKYESAFVNVSNYTTLYFNYIQDNFDAVAEDLTDGKGIPSTYTLTLTTFGVINRPTESPTSSPTTNYPTGPFSLEPTMFPTSENWTAPSLSPSSEPSVTIGVDAETLSPTNSGTTVAPGGGINVVAVVVPVCILAALATIALAIFYKQRQAKLESETSTRRLRPSNETKKTSAEQIIAKKVSTGQSVGSTSPSTLSEPRDRHEQPPSVAPKTVKESEATTKYPNQSSAGSSAPVDPKVAFKEHMQSSLLSDIDEDVYSADDRDLPSKELQSPTALHPVDEFERYKDRNLEKMRSGVEHNVAGLDDMMSQAMTMALMMDSSCDSKLLWHGATMGVEIEANALWEVTDWLRRHDPSSYDDKQEYMQSLLNRMVTSVRLGTLGPEDASRTIHECAALLGLELATQLPVTTIVLSGMQKTTTSQDVVTAFQNFGTIEAAAVASGSRGFGIVRFKSQNAANVAMQRFRISEIVVNDVPITLRLLSPLFSSPSNTLTLHR